MNLRQSILSFCAALLVSMLASENCGADTLAGSRPNVVVILCDDLGFSDIGCYGGEIRTPNLDSMAAEGLRFTQFYNNAVCVTTRASMITGLYPRQKKGGLLRANMVTLGDAMKAAGYQTGYIGKWHLGDAAPKRPVDRGFERYYGLLSGCCNFFNPGQPDPGFYNGGKLRPFADGEKTVTEFPEGYYSTDAFTDRAVEWIGEFAENDEQPFFLHLCYTAPHFPLQAPEEDIARYAGKYDDGYFALRERRVEKMVEAGLIDPGWELSPVDPKRSDFRYDYAVTPWEEVEDLPRERRRMEVYAAMVDRMDQGIGRVMAALQQAGIDDNTVVMFLSDNGGCASWPKHEAEFMAYNEGKVLGEADTYEFVGKGWGWAQNAPFRRHKTWTYEGGIATPMIVRWPKRVAAGEITHGVGHVIDFMPTLLDLAGGDYPATVNGEPALQLEGESFLPLLEKNASEAVIHNQLAWELYGNRALRQGKWKLVWGAGLKKWELYDMEKDRTETRDLASVQPDRVRAMSEAWYRWADATEGKYEKGERLAISD